MISVSGKKWQETLVDKRLIDKVRIDTKLSEIQAKVIISRNFSEKEIFSINNDVIISNPFLSKNDFITCNKILKKHIKKKNKILVIGDYDVDGCVSASLLIYFLKKISVKSRFYIPDRINDGYGISLQLIKKLVLKEKPKLVILVDCGSNSNDEINYLNNLGIESIIIDHHNINRPYPKSTVLINPKKECDYENYNYLCASFLTYLFLDLFIKKNSLNISIKQFLIYVIMATVTDVMPIRNINRFLSISVLKKFDLNNDFIIKKFFEIKKIKKRINIEDLGYFLGPILNSVGRIDNANKVVELLTSSNKSIQANLIKEFYLLNNKRKDFENKNMELLNFDKLNEKDKIIFVYKSNIPEGIIGIIAARLKDYFDKPCVVLTSSGNKIKGSARSTKDFDIGIYINKAVQENILLSGGGHNLAAGVQLNKKNLQNFQNYLNSIYKRKKNNFHNNEYIHKISLSSANKNLFNQLNKLGPFGNLNLKPLFLIESCRIIKPKVLKDKYVSCFIKSKTGKMIKAISFQRIESKISYQLMNNNNEINLIVMINENFWNNNSSTQLEIVDIIL